MVLPTFCFYIMISSILCLSAQIPAERELRDNLLNRYYWPVRPVKNYTDQLVVLLHFKLDRIAELVRFLEYL